MPIMKKRYYTCIHIHIPLHRSTYNVEYIKNQNETQAFCRKFQPSFISVLLARFNLHQLKQAELEADDAEYKARTSRLQKWKELSLQAQKDLEVHETVPDKLTCLGNLCC